jgi:hypothetical protein
LTIVSATVSRWSFGGWDGEVQARAVAHRDARVVPLEKDTSVPLCFDVRPQAPAADGRFLEAGWTAGGRRGSVDDSQARIGRVATAPLGLPRGRSSRPVEEVRAAYEQRLLHAVVAVVAKRGYAAVTVADVLAAARVSRGGFYACFPGGKEECFLAACRMGGRSMRAHIKAAVRAVPRDASPEARLRASLHSYLAFLVAEPFFAS